MGCSIAERRMTGRRGRFAVLDEPVQARVRAMRRAARPVDGDVLVSERSARADVYAISLYPETSTVVVMARYADAIEKVREMARSLDVDGWYTCNHTHYARVAARRRG